MWRGYKRMGKLGKLGIAWLVATNILSGIESGRAVYVSAPVRLFQPATLNLTSVRGLFNVVKAVPATWGITIPSALTNNYMMATIDRDFCSDFTFTRDAVLFLETKISRDIGEVLTINQTALGAPGAFIGGFSAGVIMGGAEVIAVFQGKTRENKHPCAGFKAPQ
jgi:hypothetical protein